MSTARVNAMLADMIEVERAESEEEALRAIGRRAKVGFWTLHNIKRGRAKSVKDAILDRLEADYLDLCRRQLARWQHQLNIAEATSDDNFDDLRRAISDVASRLADARAAQLDRAQRRHCGVLGDGADAGVISKN
jgi:uncharacterized protein (DUF4415 family)